MRIERTPEGDVEIWLEDEESDEDVADFSLTQDQMNALVVEWLRGPTGPQGPMGMRGESASA